MSSLAVPTLREIVDAGCRAPSADNGQPWRLRYADGQLRVSHRPERALRFDATCRSSLLAVGCLIENVILAASATGYGVELEPFPDGRESAVTAALRFAARPAREEPLARSIPARVTNRRPYAPRPLPAASVTDIEGSSSGLPGVHVRVLTDRRATSACGRLVMAADRFRYEQREFHEEVFRIIRFSDAEVAETRDGLPVRSLEMGAAGAWLLRAIRPWPRARRLHRLGLSRAVARLSYVSVIKAGGVVAVAVAGRQAQDALLLGRGLERVWLTLTRLGLSAQPLSLGTLLMLDLPPEMAGHPLAGIRADLGRLMGGLPVEGLLVLLRAGEAAPPSARSLRYPLDQVLTTAEA